MDIKPEEFFFFFEKVINKAKDKMREGYKKYGTELKVDPMDEIEEELADTINYQILNLIKTYNLFHQNSFIEKGLEQRTALITGTSRGIGKGLRDTLIKQGWDVYGCDSKNCDLVHVANIVGLVNSVPKLDLLVNNAAFFSLDRDLSPSRLERMFRVNLVAPKLLIECLEDRDKLDKNTLIINMGTNDKPKDCEKFIYYSSLKMGLDWWTCILGEQGYNIHLFNTPLTKTDMVNPNLPNYDKAQPIEITVNQLIRLINQER